MAIQKAPTYRYIPEECDIEDKAALCTYRAKRSEWLTLLQYDEEHSVSAQLSSLVWQDAVFRLFNEIRRLGPSAATAPLLAEALDNGYVTAMVLGISRLTDPPASNPKRGVVSLRRVFDDICASRCLMTRELYVCHDGLRFDPATILPPWERGVAPGRMHGVQIGGPLDVDSPKRLHEHFDKVSSKTPSTRQREDIISDETFQDISNLISSPAVKKFRDLRNKFVAHAADAISRNAAALGDFGITMNDVENALRSLLRAYHKIQIDLLWESGGGLMPTAQFNVLERLSEPFVSIDKLQSLSTFWERLADERDEWHKP